MSNKPLTNKVYSIDKCEYKTNNPPQNNSCGVFYTRFPPEPNGVLHLGHAKAICFNFDLAAENNGQTILRFDDTNPTNESSDFVDSITKSIKWLGYKPCKTTYTSDYFDQLYNYAIQLIKEKKAYVDHQSPYEIKHSRDKKIPSPWRTKRTVSENLTEFIKMKNGQYKSKDATLRLIGDFDNPCPQMWDMVIYRINFSPHHRTGNKWNIYPSYDFSHCIVDSLENIAVSCCSLEFEIRRETYYWLLDLLHLYKPHVYEFSRLEMKYTQLSKRVLKRMIDGGVVSGWDDPRLPTLDGLRQRGVPPQSIVDFCTSVGISRNKNYHTPSNLYHHVLKHLDNTAKRGFCVQSPLKIHITNYPNDKVVYLDAPDYPKQLLSSTTHKIPFGNIIYINRSDFKITNSKKYFGLTPNKEIKLKYAYNITCNNVVYDGDKVIELKCTIDISNKNRIRKGCIGWVAKEPGVDIKCVDLTLLSELFTSEYPSKNNWKNEINKGSMIVVTDCYVDKFIANHLDVGSVFQFERNGYYKYDDNNSFIRVKQLNMSNSKRVVVNKKKIKSLSRDVGSLLIRVGQIVEISLVEKSNALFKTIVDFGNETRCIISGLRQHFNSDQLLNTKQLYLCNIKPRRFSKLSVVSNGMILCPSVGDGERVGLFNLNNCEVGDVVKFKNYDNSFELSKFPIVNKRLLRVVLKDMRTNDVGQLVWKDNVGCVNDEYIVSDVCGGNVG